MDKRTLDAIMRLYNGSQEARTKDYIKYMNPNDRINIMYEAKPDYYYIDNTDYLKQLANNDKKMLEYINNILGR